MDIISLENWFGVSSLIAALVFLSLVKGSKPYELTTLLVGSFLLAVAASTAATFSNFAVIAKLLNAKRLIGTHAFDDSLRINSLWVLIYPAFVGAMGVNLLTSWFQSSKPKERDPLGLCTAQRVPEAKRSIGARRCPDDSLPSLRRHHPSKRMRTMLVRKR
jgi:hypothetical protein